MYKAVSVLIVAVLVTSGCSVSMAAKCPPKLDTGEAQVGKTRSELIAELGQPAFSGKDSQGNEYDTFSALEGCGRAAKTARAVFWALLDFGTIGIAELLLTPTEGAIQGGKVKLIVTYKNQRVINIAEK